MVSTFQLIIKRSSNNLAEETKKGDKMNLNLKKWINNLFHAFINLEKHAAQLM